MQGLRTVTSLDVSAVAGHHAMPAVLLLIYGRHTISKCQTFDCDLDCDLDLGHGNLNFVLDTPFHFVLLLCDI